MKQVINIAIFGLSLDLANQLKTCIEKLVIPSQTIQWVNIASPQLDALIVLDSFFSANTIQSIIKNKSCKFLKLVKDSSKSGKIFGDTLYYPFTDNHDISMWLKHTFPSLEQVKETPIVEKLQQDQVKVVATAKTDFKSVIDELLTSRNGFVKIFDSVGDIGIVDTRTERLWLNPERNYTTLTPTFSQTYAKGSLANHAQQNFLVKDLRVWLWQMLFNASVLQTEVAKQNACFKLNIWPQLANRTDRRDILKICACFARGAKVQHVIQHTQVTQQTLNQFIYTAMLLNMLKPIEESNVKFLVNQIQNESKDSGVFRGFLGKLRKKLGI